MNCFPAPVGLLTCSSPSVVITGLSPASILASYIINTLGLMSGYSSDDWPMFIGSLPDSDNIADDAGAIYDTSGVLDGRLMRNGTIIEHEGVQIRIRSVEYNDGWQKINDIMDALDAVLNVEVTVDSYDYVLNSLSRAASIAIMGADEKRRYSFTVNYLCTITEV